MQSQVFSFWDSNCVNNNNDYNNVEISLFCTLFFLFIIYTQEKIVKTKFKERQLVFIIFVYSNTNTHMRTCVCPCV